MTIHGSCACGSITYELDAYGGLAGAAPKLATLFAVGAFASLGLPGFSGFIAEFQMFTGSIAAAPVTAEAQTAAEYGTSVRRCLPPVLIARGLPAPETGMHRPAVHLGSTSQ